MRDDPAHPEVAGVGTWVGVVPGCTELADQPFAVLWVASDPAASAAVPVAEKIAKRVRIDRQIRLLALQWPGRRMA